MSTVATRMRYSPPPFWNELEFGIVGPDENASSFAEQSKFEKSDGDNTIYLWTDQTPHKLRKIHVDAVKLLELGPNWDGHGGKVVSHDALRFLLHVLSIVFDQNPELPSPQIVPLSYGGLQAEWHTWNADFEIEVERARRFRWYFNDRSSDYEYEEEGQDDFSNLQEYLDRL